MFWVRKSKSWEALKLTLHSFSLAIGLQYSLRELRKWMQVYCQTLEWMVFFFKLQLSFSLHLMLQKSNKQTKKTNEKQKKQSLLFPLLSVLLLCSQSHPPSFMHRLLFSQYFRLPSAILSHSLKNPVIRVSHSNDFICLLLIFSVSKPLYHWDIVADSNIREWVIYSHSV